MEISRTISIAGTGKEFPYPIATVATAMAGFVCLIVYLDQVQATRMVAFILSSSAWKLCNQMPGHR
jgi:hypothetical protein